jgi:4-diphosphocytidyl-2-C-methyl-D-erythritol kinase
MSDWLSPAKINLYLAVTGLRDDGFHAIESLVGRLDFGDTLEVTPAPRDQYSCSDPTLSHSPQNLVFRALELYRVRTGFLQPLKIHLEKRIPLGAGLGGGSSNASTMLQAVNALNPNPVDRGILAFWSLEIGSDCPLFFAEGEVLHVSGRGEIIEPFALCPESTLSGMQVMLLHPGFPITAAWAYTTLRQRFPHCYADSRAVAEELQRWRLEASPWLSSHRNDLSIPVDAKYLGIRSLKRRFEEVLGVRLMMSGSGSTCFLYLTEDVDHMEVEALVHSCWGSQAFIHRTTLV